MNRTVEIPVNSCQENVREIILSKTEAIRFLALNINHPKID